MSSTALLEFFRDMSSWPVTEAELEAACGWLSKLTGAPFVALYLVEPEGAARASYRLSGGDKAEQPGPGVIHEFLRRQIGRPGPEKGQLRHVKLARDPSTPGPLAETPHLTMLPISTELHAHSGPAASRIPTPAARRDRLWIFVGTPKALSAKDELAVLAYGEHLRHLAEKQQLESMVQLRNQFLSIASHELKTPLTSIYGMLQLQERMLRLQKKDEAPATQQEKQHGFLKMVIRQVERLNELIDGLLDVSRIQAGRFNIDPTETDVAALVRDAATTRLAVIAGEAGVRLNVEAPETLNAWVDPVRMEEVVTNIVMNAIRFSPEGGAVWISLAPSNGSLRLTVRDQGPSVPMADRERLFQPFERAPRTSRLGGLGLGLFISRQIAQLHGGNVSLVESVPGKGNVFEAHFPLRSVNLVSA